MRFAARILAGLLILIGFLLISTVITAQEIRDAELNRALYGVITTIAGIVLGIVAKVFITQRG